MTVMAWSPAGDMTLEPNALTACRTTDGNVVVTAGPGAGKTELLAQRVDFLLRTNTCAYPKRILAISFKVDSAANLRNRARERTPGDLVYRLDSHTFDAFAKRIIDRFRVALTGVNALNADYEIGPNRVERSHVTFKDLVPLALEILETNPHVLEAARRTYGYVLLDEFQDCNANQYQLVKTLFLGTKARITAVGDSKQRIMKFAGAVDGIMGKFVEEFGAQALYLYLNHRSKPVLRRMQNRVVMTLDPPAALLSSEIPGEEGDVLVIKTATAEDEATAVLAWVQERLNAGVLASEIAILYCKMPEHYGQPLFTALDSARIPYRDERKLQDLAAEPLVQLIVAYLEVIATTRAASAYSKLSSMLFRGIEDEGKVYRKRNEWFDRMRRDRSVLKVAVGEHSSRELIDYIVQDFLESLGDAYISQLSASYESKSRVTQLVDAALDRFMELLTADSDVSSALARFADDGGIRVMSIHKCKGLEFDSVAVIGVEHQMYFGDPADELSNFFVAISRAKVNLLLTVTLSRSRPQTYSGWRWDVQRTPYESFLAYASE